MEHRWNRFIEWAVAPEDDDPQVRLLREKLASGCRVVRANLVDASKATSEYLVILECKKQLSHVTIPHSESFTRWSMDTGTRMASVEEEVSRFLLLLNEGFKPIEHELGRGYFEAVLVEQIHDLAPPLTKGKLAKVKRYSAGAGTTRTKAQAAIGDVLAIQARRLSAELGYNITETASILDQAIAAYVDDRFNVDLVDALVSRNVRR